MNIHLTTTPSAFDLARPIATSEEFYSVAYNAFLAYFSRLVAGVWQSRLTQFKNTPETGQELIIVADNLVRLREFIIFYLKNIQAIDKNERVMIHSLVQTLEYCTQGLHFLLLLLPSHIGALISK